MSALTHLSADDAAWAEAMLAEWSNEECGRDNSCESDHRACGQSSASLWLRGLDPEQAAANAGFRVIQCGSPCCDADPFDAKRPSP